MQQLEKYIYNLVKNNAFIKNILVIGYQLIFFPMGLMKGKIVTKNKYIEIRHSFFGFHDRASLNRKGDVLSHVATNKFINGSGHADITVTNIHTNSTRIVAKTECCNYQQGSLLTWFSDSQIIFNDVENDLPVTVIKDINTDLVKKLPFHFFSISTDSRLVSSVNFHRFGKGLNGYGYNINYPDEFINDGEIKFSNNTISDFFIYDIEREESIYRLSIEEAKRHSYGLIEDGYYYFSHSCFSPSSDKVYFLLRSSNKLYNTSQLFCYDIVNKKLSALASGGMVSHLSWLSDSSVVAFCNTKDDKSYAYYVFDLNNNTVNNINVEGLNKDGHPHARVQDIFYTDTYPDKKRRQYLYRVNLIKKNVETILSIYSPIRFRGVGRVDFHPRLSLCGEYITVDSSHNSDRTQMVINLKD